MPTKKLIPASPAQVSVGGTFWQQYQELVRTQTIPYQWDALNDKALDAEPSHCIRNFRIAAGLEEGEYQGEVFQDSDVYKWVEAASYTLMWHPDSELEAKVNGVADLIAAAQLPDGYLDTYYIVHGLERRFTNLRGHHELYCMGHLIEAAIAHYLATGSKKLLDVACRYADCVDANIGLEEGKKPGYPGHQIAEMALVALAEITGESRYLDLATYFVKQRGVEPTYFKVEGEKYNNPFRWGDTYMKYQYYQAGKPVLKQTKPEGHAVRAVYMYSGIAEVAAATDDKELFELCQRAYNNLERRRMYITGGIGSSEHGECFTFDYDLPNDTAYAETCASVGLVFLARRMLEITGDGRYADMMERCLYNGTISGMSLDGKRFFYVNPLSVDPEACAKDYNKRHVKPERQKWFACACCPPNLARLIASLGSYAYATSKDSLWVNLYVGGEFKTDVAGQHVCLAIETNYPWDGHVHIEVNPDMPTTFGLKLHIPEWCKRSRVAVGGHTVQAEPKGGYVELRREWHPGDTVELELPLEARLVAANPRVVEDAGKVAVMRGPVVYCVEGNDNGGELQELNLDPIAPLQSYYDKDLLGGIVIITTEGRRASEEGWHDVLYRTYHRPKHTHQEIKLVPYYAWGNRGLNEMSVWLNVAHL